MVEPSGLVNVGTGEGMYMAASSGRAFVGMWALFDADRRAGRLTRYRTLETANR